MRACNMSPHTTIAHTKTPSLVLTVAFLLLINCVHPELQLKEGIEEKGGGDRSLSMVVALNVHLVFDGGVGKDKAVTAAT